MAKLADQPIRALLLGASDFDAIRDKGAFFIDKTPFVRAFMGDGAHVSCILRPRRFGKSTNLSMLGSFLALGADPASFAPYSIGSDHEFMAKHCGKYPVIYLKLKNCMGANWDDMYQCVWRCIREMVEEHAVDLSEELMEQKERGVDYSANSPPTAKHVDVWRSLQWLMEALRRKHGRKVIVLIDEFDTPLNHAFRNGYYDDAAEFFGRFYSAALKQDGGSALEKAYR